jgi:spermidine synthase
VYLGVALTALATILLELSLTRIFSVVFYYHFAFLAISIALFGLGAGGLFSYLFKGRSQRLFHQLGILAAFNSGAVILTLVYVLTRQGELDGGTLALVYLASALPFFLAGTVIATAIAETVERVDRVYFFDLVGAAAGCLFLVPLLNLLGGPNTVIGAAILFAAASAIWFTLAGSLLGRVVVVAIALGLVALIVLNIKQSIIDVRYAKGERLQEEHFVKWNSFSRIALATDGQGGETSIHIDADASSAIASLNVDDLDELERRELLSAASALPFVLRSAPRTLVIGSGGGWDVARALVAGSTDVTGVEINPIIANTIMRERFASISGGLYLRPEVRIVVGDGRSFIRRSDEQFDLLKVPVLSTWESAEAGALALSETSLYTAEAFADYLSHLTPRGIMAFTHWSFDPPRESLRLVALATKALGDIGETAQYRHIAVVRQQSGGHAIDTVLVSRSAFAQADLSRIQAAADSGNIEIGYLPGVLGDNPFAAYLLDPNPEEYLDSYPFNVLPVDDNRPFFFYTAQVSDLIGFLRNGADDTSVNRAVPMLIRLVGVSLLATAIVLTLPPIFLQSRLPKDRRVTRFLWYFVFIGVGYTVIQVALIQKFVLFLEHPTYALTVIIFSLLVSSSLGSFYSRRLVGDSDRSLVGALAAIALLVALLAVLLPPLTTNGAGWPLPLKVILTVLLIAPAGFVMGIAFPAGLARLRSKHPPSIRWAWSLNAAASVLGSASAVFLAIHLGLRETLLVGGVMYLCALFTVGKPNLPANSAEV